MRNSFTPLLRHFWNTLWVYFNSHNNNVRETHWNCPPWPGTIVTICMSYFTTGSPSKEHRTDKPPPTRRIWERSKGDATGPTISQNPPRWNASWLSSMCTPTNDPVSEWLARVNPETNPETARHVTEQLSWVLLPCCSLPGLPFPIRSLALSAHVSVDNSFLSVKQEPTLRPWKGSPFLKHKDVRVTSNCSHHTFII